MRCPPLALLLAFSSCTGPAHAETLAGTIRVIDGDTLWHYPPGRRRDPEKIRLRGIDAPESTRSSCEAELVAGLRAKARLMELIARPPVEIVRCDVTGGECEDRFGRTLADIRTPAGDVGEALMREGLALPYVAGRKADRNAHWCGAR